MIRYPANEPIRFKIARAVLESAKDAGAVEHAEAARRCLGYRLGAKASKADWVAVYEAYEMVVAA